MGSGFFRGIQPLLCLSALSCSPPSGRPPIEAGHGQSVPFLSSWRIVPFLKALAGLVPRLDTPPFLTASLSSRHRFFLAGHAACLCCALRFSQDVPSAYRCRTFCVSLRFGSGGGAGRRGLPRSLWGRCIAGWRVWDRLRRRRGAGYGPRQGVGSGLSGELGPCCAFERPPAPSLARRWRFAASRLEARVGVGWATWPSSGQVGANCPFGGWDWSGKEGERAGPVRGCAGDTVSVGRTEFGSFEAGPLAVGSCPGKAGPARISVDRFLSPIAPPAPRSSTRFPGAVGRSRGSFFGRTGSRYDPGHSHQLFPPIPATPDGLRRRPVSAAGRLRAGRGSGSGSGG